jgi:hypothetical protein
VRGRRLGLLGLALLTLAAGAVAAVLLLRGSGEPEPAAATTSSLAGLDECAAMLPEPARDCYRSEFEALVGPADDPGPVLATIADRAYAAGGLLLGDCHGLMHTVGRHYAAAHEVTMANLMDYLPQSNDPGCTAGFAHGLVTGVAPQIDVRKPRDAAAVCGDAETRFQRYSCTHGFGHAFMRLYDDELAPALELCRALGEGSAPDCAQGAYHDYWFAVIGTDDATVPAGAVTSPRELCAAQAEEFVRPCWYRALIDTRPEGFQVEVAEQIPALCADLAGVQRAGCVTAASVIGPPDPSAQLQLCAGLAAEADQVSCVQGVKVQNLLRYPERHLGAIESCDAFAGAPRTACYRWLGKMLAVITDGGFERTGCPQLAGAARRECVAGARSMEEALVTFS